MRGPGRKYGTSVSGWQQQLVSRIGVLDHAEFEALLFGWWAVLCVVRD